MRKLKTKFRKGMACILTACTAFGVFPAMSGGIMKAYAAQDSSKLSVTAYATVEQLKNSDNFALNASYGGVAKKVAFGKDGSGNTQYWYIAGADPDKSSNKGLVLMAVAPLLKDEKFQTVAANISNAEGKYTDTTPAQVYANHYGSSSVRDRLQGLESDTAYFSAAEQGLMKETTVYTYDTKNHSTYSTTDKLYLAGGYANSEYITVGSNSFSDINAGLKVDVTDPYISKGLSFWLRSAAANNGQAVCMAQTGAAVSSQWNVVLGHDVLPAFSLDMSKVLFASAVPVASDSFGKLTNENPFVIRLDGSTQLNGSSASCKSGEITISQAANKTVTLAVQGRDENNDWYYKTTVSGNKAVTADTIKTALGLTESPDMSKCEIWLETTKDNVTYALPAKKEQEPDIPDPEPDKKNGFVTENGRKYWYEDGVKQGTEGRGKEIYDPDTDAWYWLDAIQGGAVAAGKDVYQESNGGKWVRYDENGHMIKGWDTTEAGTYYFDMITGAMAKGEVTIDKIVYRFNDITGILFDMEFYTDENGSRFWYEGGVRQGTEGRGKEIYDPESDSWYWLDSIDGGKVATSKDVYQESWAGPYADREDGTGKWVRYDENGRMIKGWDQQNGNTYYFDMITGAMAKGNAEIDGERYYFDKQTGILVSKL